MKQKLFTAEQFTPTQFDSAEQKAKFANHFVRFVESDYKESLFFDWFYKRLSMCFGHIAHYDRGGFYSNFFWHFQCRSSFIHQTLQHPCYGSPEFTYSDVEKVLQQWMKENNVLEKFVEQSQKVIEMEERAQLAQLKGKYEGA